MRVLMFDIDTLRSDHMGCYGYRRNTTPAIDSIARDGVTFTNYYCPNAPCLPSRASLVSGKYGFRTGVVGHGGTAADMRLEGAERGFNSEFSMTGLFMQFRMAGMHTASFSTFAERHSAWWFNAGFNECYNVGGRGMESAEAVTPHVLDWIERNADNDNWFLHVHFWDPHTPYRVPASFGNPFENEPLSDGWITDEVFARHLRTPGPHSAMELNMWNDQTSAQYPRNPGRLASAEDAKRMIDQYDCGVRYADNNVGQILSLLREKGIYNDDLAIIFTSDHGENMGELGIYGEHATADEPTCHIPMIIKWPGAPKGVKAEGMHDNTDLLPTVRDLLGLSQITSDNPYFKIPPFDGDGVSYAKALRGGADEGRKSVIMTQCCHVCQRSTRFGDWLYVRTYHGGYHLLERELLFNIKDDPHEQHDLAREYPELCREGARLILEWQDEQLDKCPNPVDPLWTVMKEGGPLHARGALPAYVERLKATGRSEYLPEYKRLYPSEPWDKIDK